MARVYASVSWQHQLPEAAAHAGYPPRGIGSRMALSGALYRPSQKEEEEQGEQTPERSASRQKTRDGQMKTNHKKLVSPSRLSTAVITYASDRLQSPLNSPYQRTSSTSLTHNPNNLLNTRPFSPSKSSPTKAKLRSRPSTTGSSGPRGKSAFSRVISSSASTSALLPSRATSTSKTPDRRPAINLSPNQTMPSAHLNNLLSNHAFKGSANASFSSKSATGSHYSSLFLSLSILYIC